MMRYRIEMNARNVLKILLILTISHGLIACVHTRVHLPEIDPAVRALASSNRTLLAMKIDTADLGPVLGHQYLFFVFPFGRVLLRDAEDEFFKSAYRSAALSGYSPILASEDSEIYPRLELTFTGAQATAYDFFVVRKISTKLKLRAKLLRSKFDVEESVFEESDSAFKRFAFKKQLDFFFERAVEKVFQQLENMLSDSQGYTPSQRAFPTRPEGHYGDI